MDAEVTVFARDGFEAVSVYEITRLDDVANGTYYAHFKNREDFAQVVAVAVAGGVAAERHEAMGAIDETVERVARATRSFVELGEQGPDLAAHSVAGAVVATEPSQRRRRFRARRHRARRPAARFQGPPDDALLGAFAAVTRSALNARVEGAGPEAGGRVAVAHAGCAAGPR